ncbi:MAG TPA: hypothetical protein VGB13_10125, partial [Candidatus Krumholzibacteria bacterium]
MPAEDSMTVAGRDAKSALDIRDCVAWLRESMKGRTGRQIEGLIDSISTAAEQVVGENLGMADELICVYEQLGVVFQVTRRLPELQDERQILQLFMENLRQSFSQRELLVARRVQDSWRIRGSNRAVTPWLGDLLTRAATKRAVLIESPGPDAFDADTAEVLAGPIFSGDSLVCEVVFLRASNSAPFRSGEMLLVDSLTTFCGDLIRSHRLLRELQQMSVAMVRALVNAVDQKDEYTCGHSLRVAFYADVLGRLLNLTPAQL